MATAHGNAERRGCTNAFAIDDATAAASRDELAELWEVVVVVLVVLMVAVVVVLDFDEELGLPDGGTPTISISSDSAGLAGAFDVADANTELRRLTAGGDREGAAGTDGVEMAVVVDWDGWEGVGDVDTETAA